MATPLDDTFKNTIAADLTIRIAKALKSGELPEDQLASVCQDVLDHKDEPTTQEEFLAMLTELVQRWPIFSSVLTTIDRKKQAIHTIDTMFQRSNKQNQTIQ
jgi:hypothetical protein